MKLPATIEAQVGPELISRVTRLYNGTVRDCLHELLQNARRAGATRIEIDAVEADGDMILSIHDDGSGIDNPGNLLTLGQSGWDAEIAAREDPAGMGVFSLAGRHVIVKSFSRAAGHGWQVEIPADAWQGRVPLAVEPSDILAGTVISVACPQSWQQQLDAAVAAVARYYPLPVFFRGCELSRCDFLQDAWHIEEWQGCRIGVFVGRGGDHHNTPRINFHGLTVPCRHGSVEEVDRITTWSARVDIVDAPALQLVLPARKEMVENDALSALRLGMETAIYRAIAKRAEHRLPFKNWLRAAALDVKLPEASPWLGTWVPITADSHGRGIGNKVWSAEMIIVEGGAADLEQAAAPIIRDFELLGAHPVCAEPAFRGYAWYDGLRRIRAIDFTFETQGKSWFYGDTTIEPLPSDLPSGRVSQLMLELAIASSSDPDVEAEVRTFEVDMLVVNNDAWCLDEAIILVAEGAAVDPCNLANLMESSLFCSSDDGDCDSWETQNENFGREARNLANSLLLGEEGALLARLRELVANHVLWCLPTGRRLVVSATRQNLELSLELTA